MPVTHENAQDIPLWALILSCLISALAGEFYRVGTMDMPWSQIFKRVVLRYMASFVVGGAAMMIAFSYDASFYLAVSIGWLTSLAGADVALGIYNSVLKKKLGIDTASNPAQPTPQASQADNGQL